MRNFLKAVAITSLVYAVAGALVLLLRWVGGQPVTLWTLTL